MVFTAFLSFFWRRRRRDIVFVVAGIVAVVFAVVGVGVTVDMAIWR